MANPLSLLTCALALAALQSSGCKSPVETKKEETKEARDHLKKLNERARSYYESNAPENSTAPTKHYRCERAFAHANSLARVDWPKDATAEQRAILEPLETNVATNGIARCRADAWSAQTTSCMQAATSGQADIACFSQLTPEQLKNMRQDSANDGP